MHGFNDRRAADLCLPETADPVLEADSWQVMICLLGEFRLMKGSELLTVHSRGKGGELLRLLGLKYHTCVRREAILDRLWPDSSSDLAAQSLNSLVYSLHKLLGEYIGGAAPVVYCEGFYRLNVQAGIGVDVAVFDRLARRSETAAHAGSLNQAAEYARQAIEYYQGDLTDGGDFSVRLELERLRTLFLTLLACLADYHYSIGDYLNCLDYAHRLLEHDHCREDAHRMVMRCYVRRGQRAAALRQFLLCQSILQTEFEAVPELATIALYDQIRTEPQLV
jgi:DNA-binding SARP family transcriptional activator